MIRFIKVCVAGVIFVVNIMAQIPQLINYQGHLVNSEGDPLNGSHEIEFRLYDQATSGTLLWNEIQTVEVTQGILNVLLGSVSPINPGLFDGSDRFLTLKVGADSEMSPRTKLTSVAYAFRALNADSLNGKGSDDFVGTGQANAITHEMIQENIVSSINHVTNDGGNIDLIAGSNISIAADNANHQITISAAGGGASEGDNLGDHQATQNLNMNGFWINHDGGASSNEGIFIDTEGKVGIGTHTPSEELTLWGTLKSMTHETGSANAIEGIAYSDGDYENHGGKFLAYGEQGIGVMGVGMNNASVTNFGGYFIANGEMGTGAVGLGQGLEAIGVFGKSTGDNGIGVQAEVAGEHAKAVSAEASGESGIAVYGIASDSTEALEVKNYGGYFKSSGRYGIGLYSEATGIYGSSIYAKKEGNSGYAISAEADKTAIRAQSNEGIGIFAITEDNSGVALYGHSEGNTSIAVKGVSQKRDLYNSNQNYAGWFEAQGDGSRALYAQIATNDQDIIGLKVVVAPGRKAAEFYGNVNVFGHVYKSGGGFKIDHPQDPENKYLQHSFVESPDMMNVYNGIVELNGNGYATVKLPEYFEDLNIDFRYQLTPIGSPMPNLYIAQKIENNEFMIAGGEPNKEVSWQVTGIRNDTFAKENRIPVEVDKTETEKNQKEGGWE
ncbi:MAG: hypothetical protein JXQ65_07235 [Candidatus Marinimicrobia bacterium]|nr:hypothetical protein [Candidatus Neomarinimicrobiota bacterium]